MADSFPFPANEYIEPPPVRQQLPAQPAEDVPGLLKPMLDWLIHTGKLVPVEHDPFAPEAPPPDVAR